MVLPVDVGPLFPPAKLEPTSPSSSIKSEVEDSSQCVSYTSLDSVLHLENKDENDKLQSFSLFDLGVSGSQLQIQNHTDSSDPTSQRPMRVLFLSSDTGGGHRASAESLANQLKIQYPGSSYDLLDVWIDDGVWPYRTFVKFYKFFSANPSHWRVFYHLSNLSLVNSLVSLHSTWACEQKIRKRIESYNPDVVISVHPTMQHVPILACRNISLAQGRHIPFFTVVTDLASAHVTWFERGVDKIYVASDSLHNVARHRASIPERNIVRTGLPIRHDFAVQADKLGDRNSSKGKAYQREIKNNLGFDPSKPMILLMGGGEGVGGLSCIVNKLYAALATDGVDATLCVVCGRNEKLMVDLQDRDWNAVLRVEHSDQKSICCHTAEEAIYPKLVQKQLERSLAETEEKKEDGGVSQNTESHSILGEISVVGLGFTTKIAEYMVAASVLVTKAGPGTISEAASLGLPVLLTSFLPGQEAGNVDFVLEHGFGAFCEDPREIGMTLSIWLQNGDLLDSMSAKAKETGRPRAAAEIVADIGATTQAWLRINEQSKTLRSQSSGSPASWFVDGITEFVVT